VLLLLPCRYTLRSGVKRATEYSEASFLGFCYQEAFGRKPNLWFWRISVEKLKKSPILKDPFRRTGLLEEADAAPWIKVHLNVAQKRIRELEKRQRCLEKIMISNAGTRDFFEREHLPPNLLETTRCLAEALRSERKWS
jgi:hypothetical protein